MSTPISPIHFDLSAEEAAIIRKCAMDEFRASETYLRPLGRYGNSGAKLFAARFGGDTERAEYVVKVIRADKAEHEWSALPFARRFFPEVGNGHITSDEAAGVGATMYRLHRHRRDGIVELRDLVLDPRVPARRIVKILNQTYTDFLAAHSPTQQVLNYGSDYAWYLRPSRHDRLDEAFGSDDTVSLFASEYPNPVRILNLLKARDARVPSGWVHGDLHPNNVMIGRYGQPAVIDFAWFREFDITVDFALMECSIRFLLFPQSVDWATHQAVNDALLDERGTTRVIGGVVRGGPLYEAYAKMVAAVGAIRRNARSHAGTMFDWDHYVATQFIVLYGLANIESYPFFHTTDALARIGQRVAERLRL